MQKTLCPTHHLFYAGTECPMCSQERLERYSEKYCKHSEHKPKAEKDRDITEDDLAKLMNKFNSK